MLAIPGGPGFDSGYLRGLGEDVTYADLRTDLEDWTLERTADEVAAACDGPAVVFGHSAGGFTALVFALRYPELVRGLVLCDTGASLQPIEDPDPAPHLRDRAPAEVVAIAERVWSGDRSAFEDFQREVVPYYAAPEHMDVPNALFARSSYAPEVGAHFFATIAPTYDVRPRLHEITAPTVVVHGEHDWVVPRERARELARGLPNARLEFIPNAGHFPFAEEPEAFRRALGD
jgi:proline iminopeptidase